MFKKIALALVVLVAAFCGYVATRPSTFQIERSATVKAPPTSCTRRSPTSISGRAGRRGRSSTPR